jgi:hypothetical protein
MNGSDIPVLTLVVVSFLTWLVFVITACKFYKFFNVFENYKSKNDVELNSLVWHAKKLDGTLAEITAELRRANKLLYEIDMGKCSQNDAEPEHEFNSEDILRHKKMDLNKTPSSLPIDYSSRQQEHKTVSDVAGLQHCLDELAKTATQGAPPASSVQMSASGARSTQPVDHQGHNSEKQPHHHVQNAQPSEPAGTFHLKKTPVAIDMDHLPPPPDDSSGKLSIDTLSSRAGQVDLQHLTEGSGAVFVKIDKSHNQP